MTDIINRNILTGFFLLCSIAFSYGQPSEARKAYERAGKHISKGYYSEAIEELNKVIYLDDTYITAYQQLGDIYRKLGLYPLAKNAYEKVLKLNPDFLPITFWGLAESEFNLGNYAIALQYYTKYASLPITPSSKKLCAKYIADCEFSIKAIKDPVSFYPINIGAAINTKDGEYLPSVTADGQVMIFTRRSNQRENLYRSDKKDDKWTKATVLKDSLNTNFNEGAQCISQDGMYLFFTGCNRPDGLGRCDIYVAAKEHNSWSKPFNIGAPINTSAWESQPSLSADGKTLYFSSNRSGGIGGYDIWKSDLKADGSWAEPINMGPNINTPYDEQAPFIHADDQTFYFSSSGWPGLGKKDMFVSRLNALGQWDKPTNLGYPINSFHEESGLCVSRDGQTGYFSADREDTFGGLDIYYFEIPKTIRPSPVTYVKGVVIDQDSKQVLDAHVQVTDLETGKSTFDDWSDSGDGNFLATMRLGKSFGLIVSKEGYLFHSENFSLKDGNSNTPFNITINLEKIDVGRKSTLNNIFFETNKYNLLPESRVELNELITFLTQNPGVEIELRGNTDNTGNETFNQILSENRAKTVYNYLIASGIDSKVLSYKGYGSSNPIGDNATEDGRKLNRRTEFKITKK